jgi:BirA family transcriptional regulator, biotin operon repressor / biotin---[acetyl-CoA-carboxylase] ligase
MDLERAAALVAERGTMLGRPLVLLPSATSTNDLALRAARDGAAHGATWVAERQTAGRGRRGRAWVSASGESLLFSVLLRPACPPAGLPPIGLLCGLAVRDAVARAAPGVPISIKWPNDVLAAGRKLAGVLVEAVTVGSRVEAVVVGIGINVHTRSFPDELAESATSVGIIVASSGAPPDRGVLLADVLQSIDQDLHVVVAKGLGLLRERIAAADVLRGRRVRSDSGEEGLATGVDDEGRLLVRADDGVVQRWAAGEVNLVKT